MQDTQSIQNLQASPLSGLADFWNEFMGMREELQEIKRQIQELNRRNTKQEYYNIKQAAEYLNISIRSARRLIDRGLIKKSLGIGKIQIPRDSLENYRKLTVNY